MARRTIQEYTPVVGMRLVPTWIDRPVHADDVVDAIEIIETRGEGDALELRVQHGSRRVWQRKRTWAERYRPVDVASEPVQSALPLSTPNFAQRNGELMPAHSITEERVRAIVREGLRQFLAEWAEAIRNSGP